MLPERKFWIDAGRAFALFLVGLLAAGWISAYFFPPVIAAVENRLGAVLPYEFAMRFYLGGLVFLILAAYAGWAISVQSRPHKLTAGILAVNFLALLLILVFDTKNPLMDEPSWIRYPTSGFLFSAAALLWLVSRYFNRGEKWPGRREAVWYILSAGLIFAAADELLQIHERLGTLLEKTFKLAHITTDLITVAYGLIGLAAMWFILPTVLETVAKQSRLFGQIYIFAFLMFGLSTALDTLDGVLLSLLRRAAAWLANRPGYFFSDAWNIFYDPKVFANSLEEILECFAAALFFSGALILLLSFVRPHPSPLPAAGEGRPSPPLPSRERAGVRGIVWLSIPALFLLAVIFFVFLNRQSIFSRSPLVSGEPAEIIASVKDGLFHTDDLAYHPKWGLVIANESHPARRGRAGGPAVFVFKDGKLSKLADPEHLLGDTDSVAADEQGIYASDGAQGKILVYKDEAAGFQELYSRADGLATPESLEIYQGITAILDERKKSVTEIKPGRIVKSAKGQPYAASSTISIAYPRHELFVSPEGIVYHPQLKSYLITDDKSGTIFKYPSPLSGDKGEGPVVWAGQNAGLKNPEDILVTPAGDIIVTDNGRGEVLLLNQNGGIKKSLRFRPLFRDLQGVALDEAGNLYVVSADAHDYASFMPSFVWKIPNFYQ